MGTEGIPSTSMKLLFVEISVGFDQHGQDWKKIAENERSFIITCPHRRKWEKWGLFWSIGLLKLELYPEWRSFVYFLAESAMSWKELPYNTFHVSSQLLRVRTDDEPCMLHPENNASKAAKIDGVSWMYHTFKNFLQMPAKFLAFEEAYVSMLLSPEKYLCKQC